MPSVLYPPPCTSGMMRYSPKGLQAIMPDTDEPFPNPNRHLDRRSLVAALLAAALVATTAAVIPHYSHPINPLKSEVAELTTEVNELRQEQEMPSLVLNRYRGSICYIFGVYRVGFASNPLSSLRARVAGTGFVVADGLLATNRHVAEPWYGDPEAEALIHRGATAKLEKLLAYFPELATPIDIDPVVISPLHDLAIVHMQRSADGRKFPPLPLAEQAGTPGELVTVIGYPMGVAGMVAKSPQVVYERLAYRHDDASAASELAALSLIRPSATYGHLGDVVGSKLVYDAPTAHGGSGGPVFDSHGHVIGINTAYMDGFSGGTLGISVVALKPLIVVAQQTP
jgi:S1-C subfamily serine protease